MKRKIGFILVCIMLSITLLSQTTVINVNNIYLEKHITASEESYHVVFDDPVSNDTDPPTPNPITFASPPAPVSSSAVTMTASKAYDESPPITYFFLFWTPDSGNGGNNRFYNVSRTYVDDGLDPNSLYKYSCRARDDADPRNYGYESGPMSTYTLAEIPSAPTLSEKTDSTLNVDVQPNGNPSYTEFAIKCDTNDITWEDKYVDASGNPSGTEVWQTDAQWGIITVQGLGVFDPDKYYCFRVKARNEDLIETAFGVASFLHYYGPYPPGDFTAYAANRTKIDLSWIIGYNADNTYIRYKQGATPPSDREDGIFLYNDTGTSTSVTGLLFGTQYSFKAWSWGDTNNIWGVVTSTSNAITDSNTPPETPDQPDGPVEGYAGIEYTYSADTTDPDDDNVLYKFDWGDGTDSGWISSSISGNKWDESGDYEIKVKAKDTYGAESNWSPPLNVIITDQIQEEPKLVIDVQSSVVEDESFNVIVSADNDFIENVKIEFIGESYYTDTDGTVTITAPPVEDNTGYLITASKEGYQSDSLTITVLNMKEEEPRGWIYGVIFHSSELLYNVQILISGNDKSWVTYTDEKGRYVQSLSIGTYNVQASKEGYEISSRSGIIVEENKAIGTDFKLEESTISNGEDGGGIAKLIVESRIEEGDIGAEIDATSTDHHVTLYSDVDVDVTESNLLSEGKISFSVASDDETGKILVIYVAGVIDPEKVVLTYDEETIARTDDIIYFFSDQNSIESWVIIPTGVNKEEYALLFNVPEFSTHTITISSILEPLGGITTILSLIMITTIAALIFLVPVYLMYFKKVKE